MGCQAAGDPDGLSGSREPVSLFQRMILVFTDPSKAFAGIAIHPRWIGAFLLVIVVGILSAQATFPYIMEVQQNSLQQTMTDLPPERAEAMMERFSPEHEVSQRIWMVFTPFIGGMLELLILAGLFTFGCSFLLGGEASFKQVMAVVAHALLIRVPKALLVTPLILMKGSISVSTSLAVLIPMDRWMTPLGVLLQQADIFKLWGISLLITGLAVVYRFSKGKVAALVIGFFVCWVVVQVAVVMLFSNLFAGFTG